MGRVDWKKNYPPLPNSISFSGTDFPSAPLDFPAPLFPLEIYRMPYALKCAVVQGLFHIMVLSRQTVQCICLSSCQKHISNNSCFSRTLRKPLETWSEHRTYPSACATALGPYLSDECSRICMFHLTVWITEDDFVTWLARDNGEWKSLEGVLYSKDSRLLTLYMYSQVGSVIISHEWIIMKRRYITLYGS